MSKVRKFKFSGRIAEDDSKHLLKEQVTDASTIPPNYVYVEGIGNIPQYAPTIFGRFNGYNPPTDCNGYFMSAKFQPNNNCYAYGCVITSNSFPQPGRINGHRIPKGFTGADVVKGATKDGLVSIGASMEALKTHQKSNTIDGHYVALLISPADDNHDWPGDYHWVRCDDNVQFLSWSQKDGGDQVTNFDFAGEPITNPEKANWTVNQGPTGKDEGDLLVQYNFYSYLFVPSTGVDII